MVHTFFSCKKCFSFLVMLLISHIINAQNPGMSDLSLGLGTFNKTINDIAIQSDGKVIVVGDFITYKDISLNRIARLNADGTLDNTFKIGFGFDSSVKTIAIDKNDKILLGGSFTTYNGFNCNYLVRLNNDGSIDNTFNIGTGPNSEVNTIALQHDGKILIGGAFLTLNGTPAGRIIRLNQNGSTDSTFNIGGGFNNKVNAIKIQIDGKILVGGSFSFLLQPPVAISKYGFARLNTDGSSDSSLDFGSYSSGFEILTIAIDSSERILIGGTFRRGINIARIEPNGLIDHSFSGNGANNLVRSIAVQRDGKILIGGDFTTYGGTEKFQDGLSRVNDDGTIDLTFKRVKGTHGVRSIIIQSDDKILIGGSFQFTNGYPTSSFSRLNTDGSTDTEFNIGMGANNVVNTIVPQRDGKILIGGSFTIFNGVPKNYMVRLKDDHSIDSDFNIGTGANSTINIITIQPDGKILAAGTFTSFNGVNCNSIIRLNPDGSVDNSFNSGSGTNSNIYSIVVQSDGKILVGGNFYSFNGSGKSYLVRLNSNGSIDNTFMIGNGANDIVYKIVLLENGKIIIGGNFSTFNGNDSYRLIRLHQEGSIDYTFGLKGNANSTIYDFAVQPDGRILVAGSFTALGGLKRKYLVRLNPNGSNDGSFVPSSAISRAILKICLQKDNNKILIAGPNLFARINIDGSIDDSFSGIYDNIGVNSIVFLNNGKILIGGNFTMYQNYVIYSITRLGGDPIYSNIVHGKVYSDRNRNCIPEINEKPISSVVIKALPGPYYGGTDAAGNYALKVDSGNVQYTLTQEFNSINSELLLNQCAPSHKISLHSTGKDTCCVNFADSVKQCALLSISMERCKIKRCHKGFGYIYYGNYGNNAAKGVQIKVIYPTYMRPVSSDPPWTSIQDSLVIFDIGQVDAMSGGSIKLLDSVLCVDDITGLTQCIKATISPLNNCTAADPAWDNSSINVTGRCIGASAHFNIINEGNGDMDSKRFYKVYLNDTLIHTGQYQLKSGEELKISYPVETSVVRLEADQSPYHPSKRRPRTIVEGCTLPVPWKFFPSSYGKNDLDEQTSVGCYMIKDSYDPNDKMATPVGVGSAHNIFPGEAIEYTIRFQNTGTDTAYYVRIVDTLDVALDVSSFKHGVSSHPFTLDISGKGNAVLTYSFVGINLPDSTADQAGSNGLISFRVAIPSNVPIGTIIKNKASIYFDYNKPVVTNETFHTVDTTVFINLAKGSLVQEDQMILGEIPIKSQSMFKIYPNPSTGIITIETLEGRRNDKLIIYSTIGVLQKTIQLNSENIQQVKLVDLREGLYIYEILQEGNQRTKGLLELRSVY